MEYAKKMVVVPPELIARLEHTNSTAAAQPASISNLDTEMTRILSDKRLADNDKWKLYQQVLQRHLHVSAVKREPINLPIIDTEMALAEDRMQRTSIALVDELVESFPKIYKSEARALLKAMANRDDLVSWDSDGFVYVNNKKIPNSNITDIMHSIVRARKIDPLPAGWHEVMQALKDMRIPSTFVNNEAALRFLGREIVPSPITSPGTALYSSPDKSMSSLLKKARASASPSRTTTPASTPIARRLRSRQDKSPSMLGWESFSRARQSKK